MWPLTQRTPQASWEVRHIYREVAFSVAFARVLLVEYQNSGTLPDTSAKTFASKLCYMFYISSENIFTRIFPDGIFKQE